jgi:hypothetical protein
LIRLASPLEQFTNARRIAFSLSSSTLAYLLARHGAAVMPAPRTW